MRESTQAAIEKYSELADFARVKTDLMKALQSVGFSSDETTDMANYADLISTLEPSLGSLMAFFEFDRVFPDGQSLPAIVIEKIENGSIDEWIKDIE